MAREIDQLEAPAPVDPTLEQFHKMMEANEVAPSQETRQALFDARPTDPVVMAQWLLWWYGAHGMSHQPGLEHIAEQLMRIGTGRLEAINRTLAKLEETSYRIRTLAKISDHVTALGDDDDGLLEHVCYELPRRAAKLTKLVDRAQQQAACIGAGRGEAMS